MLYVIAFLAACIAFGPLGAVIAAAVWIGLVLLDVSL